MTTIILICLGIILAAAATTMTVYYGGEAFGSGKVKTQAATLENAAQNIQAAMTGRQYRGNRAMPVSLDQLSSNGSGDAWIGSLPDVTHAEGGQPRIMVDGSAHLYAVPGIASAVCQQVNRDYHGEGSGIPDNRGDVPRGCFRTAAGDHVFFSVIGRQQEVVVAR